MENKYVNVLVQGRKQTLLDALKLAVSGRNFPGSWLNYTYFINNF